MSRSKVVSPVTCWMAVSVWTRSGTVMHLQTKSFYWNRKQQTHSFSCFLNSFS